MALERETFTVYVSDPDDTVRELHAVITHQDMLRGEQMMLGDPGTSLKQGLALATAWCWASLMRQQDYSGAWQQFRDMDCQGIEKGEPVTVDPTQPATGEGSP